MSQKSSHNSGVIRFQYVTAFKKQLARQFRKNPTPAERCLWEHLRKRQCYGLKFRRQQVIDGFIVDFYCDSLRLIVEVDGAIHNTPEQKEYDLHRRKVFEARGLREIRFTNDEVLGHTETVLEKIGRLRFSE